MPTVIFRRVAKAASTGGMSSQSKAKDASPPVIMQITATKLAKSPDENAIAVFSFPVRDKKLAMGHWLSIHASTTIVAACGAPTKAKCNGRIISATDPLRKQLVSSDRCKGARNLSAAAAG